MPNTEYLIQSDTLSGIANAIRNKTGGSSPIPVSEFAGDIGDIQTGHTTTIDGVEVDRDLDLASINMSIPNIEAIDANNPFNSENQYGCLGCKIGEYFYICIKGVESWVNNWSILRCSVAGGSWSVVKTITDTDISGITDCNYARCFCVNDDELYISFHNGSVGCVIVNASDLNNISVLVNCLVSSTTVDGVSIHGILGIGTDINQTKLYVLLSEAISSPAHVYVFYISNGTITCINTSNTIALSETIVKTNKVPYLVYDNDSKGISLWSYRKEYSSSYNTALNWYNNFVNETDSKFREIAIPIGFNKSSKKVYLLSLYNKNIYSFKWNETDGKFKADTDDGYGTYPALGDVVYAIQNNTKPLTAYIDTSPATTATIKMIDDTTDLPNSSLVNPSSTVYAEV